MAAAAPATAGTAPTLRRGLEIIIIAELACSAGKSKGRKQATNFFAMTAGTNDIIGVLMADQQLKFRFTVRAIVFVQGHMTLPPILARRPQDLSYCSGIDLSSSSTGRFSSGLFHVSLFPLSVLFLLLLAMHHRPKEE
jgi:hypothetical protein